MSVDQLNYLVLISEVNFGSNESHFQVIMDIAGGGTGRVQLITNSTIMPRSPHTTISKVV